MTKKILNPTINVSPADFLNLAWDTQRYCIGRKTGHSSGMAEVIWRYIRDNRDKFNQDRLLFFARDIRANISDVVHWYKNCSVENAYNDRINFDAYSLLVQYLEANPEVDFKTNKFHIDCLNGEVNHEEKGGESELYSFPDCYIVEWIKLANRIDCLIEVELSDGDKSETKLCIEAPTHKYDSEGKFMGTDEMKLFNADNWHCYVAEEYIKSVKRINNDKTEQL